MLRVLGRVTSINVRKVLWALDEVGLAYEREDWGMPLRDPNVPQFLALNPNGQVPVLIADDLVLWESNAILIYLAERAAALLPVQLEKRALVLQWLVWQGTELNPTWSYAVQALIRKTPGYDDPALIKQSMVRWGAAMALLERHLRGRDFVAGNTFSIADIALGLSVHRWMYASGGQPDLPAVSRYYALLREREAGARWMTPDLP